jgi:hypothetical protein
MSKFIIELVGVDVFIDILVVTPGSLEFWEEIMKFLFMLSVSFKYYFGELFTNVL